MGLLESLGFGGNKKKDKRTDLDPPIKCLCAYRMPAGQEGEYTGLITNFSENGILLGVSKGKIPAGAQVEVRFQLPHHPEGVSVHGTIASSYPERPQAWSYADMEFKDKEEGGVRLLLAFIAGKL